MSFEVTDQIDEGEWRAFVSAHPHGNIFQTPEMAEVFRKTRNYEPVTLALLNKGEIGGVVQAALIREIDGLLGGLTTRAIISGGPLVDPQVGNDGLRVLMQEFDRLAGYLALYSEVRNLFDTSGLRKPMEQSGYSCTDQLTFLIDLTQTEDEIFNKMDRSKRKGIRRGRKNQVVVETLDDQGLIPMWYECLCETYKRAKIPLADISLFQSVYDVLARRDMATFYFARQGDEVIAGSVILHYGDLIYAWYMGCRDDYTSSRANELLVWQALQRGANQDQYKVFNFGGGGKPGERYGVHEFNKRFGGVEANLGRYKKVHQPYKLNLAMGAFDLYKNKFGENQLAQKVFSTLFQ